MAKCPNCGVGVPIMFLGYHMHDTCKVRHEYFQCGECRETVHESEIERVGCDDESLEYCPKCRGVDTMKPRYGL